MLDTHTLIIWSDSGSKQVKKLKKEAKPSMFNTFISFS